MGAQVRVYLPLHFSCVLLLPLMPPSTSPYRLHQAQSLMELARAFYTCDEDYESVYSFNHRQATFDFEQLLDKLKIPRPQSQ